jgi:NAD(P)-dependent dehydrogenase (short-subunit alcohol dehydrogenase family)
MHSKEGIQCNAILPGGVMTNITATSGVEFNPETNPYLAAFYACIPGVCQPAEIAETVFS